MRPKARFRFLVLGLAAVAVPGALGRASAGAAAVASAEVPVGGAAEEAAARLLEAAGAAGGVCAVVGATDGDLAVALGRRGPLVVHALVAEGKRLAAVRRTIAAAGLYGRVSADLLSGAGASDGGSAPGAAGGARLPYAENLVNLAVVEGVSALAPGGSWAAEVGRVLAPLGTAAVRVRGETRAEDLARALSAAGLQGAEAIEAGGRWVVARKPWPPDIDEWTHYLHGPDNNPVARDLRVGPPARMQWTADPPWLQSHETVSSVSTLVTARGRLYAIVNEAPISLAGPHAPPDAWFLVARDAFNGMRLWKVPIRRWGWREWKPSWFSPRPNDIPLNLQKRLAAVGDRVYVTLGYRAPVSELDGRTGRRLRTFPGTERTNELLVTDRWLLVSTVEPDAEAVRIAAVDLEAGRRRWRTAETYRGTTVDYIRWKAMRGSAPPAKLDPAPNLATDGRETVALIDGPNLVALDLATGRRRWSAPFPMAPTDETAGGMKARGRLWNGTVIVTGGVVLHASPNRLGALDARTGKVLWTRPKAYIGHLWYEWKDVFVIDGVVWTWGEDLAVEPLARSTGPRKMRSRFPTRAVGYDLRTGRVAREVALGPLFKSHHHHRCYRNKATVRYILASRRGTEFVSLTGGPHTIHNWVRGTCHVGMMPACGLQYVPPHPCVCYIEEKLNGFLALAPASEAGGTGGHPSPAASTSGAAVSGPAVAPLSGAPVSGAVAAVGPAEGDHFLERGPAYGRVAPAPAASPEADWPAFRHDAARTGTVAAPVPDGVKVRWRVAVGRRLSPPVAVADRVLVALVDEHQVACLDARTGAEAWRFTAGGRIDSPPTWHRGTVLFGSADGWVYCVRARDGVLVWRFRAAPGRRLVGAHEQLESAWPVHGSVLVLEDGPGAAGPAGADGAGRPAGAAAEGGATAYVVAGRSSHLDGGLHLWALDAATGAVRRHRVMRGPFYPADAVEENYRLPMGALPDILVSDGQHIYMRTKAFDRRLQPVEATPLLRPTTGFLDDAYFKRTPWRIQGLSDWGRLIVHDRRSAYYVRMFDSLKGLSPDVYFTPAAEGYLLFARPMDRKKSPTWSLRMPVRVRAMAAAGDRLFAAGPPDVVDPADPWGAFQGRKGGLLYVFDAATGRKVAEHRLPSPPVFNGLAAARGRLFLAAEDGRLTCLAE